MKKLVSRKEKQYLIFQFDDGKDVKFDLSDGSFIGKSGKPVKSLESQLKGYSIQQVIDSFEDCRYRDFLNHIRNTTQVMNYYGDYNYKNLSTFLCHVRKNLNLEQFFASGFLNIVLSETNFKMSDIPKALIKISKNNGVIITALTLKRYNENPDLWQNILNSNFEMFDTQKLINSGYYTIERFFTLVNNYNYNAMSLCQYIDNVMVYEGIDSQRQVIDVLYDYVTMCSQMSNKFNKYPKYLLTIHNITVRNYNKMRKQYEEGAFKKRVKTDMEFKYLDWVFIYPKSTSEIKDEAVQQSNCVAGYIESVINGKCDIIFMRKEHDLQSSFITLEVKNNMVVQAKGRYNRDCTDREKYVISKYEQFLQNKSSNIKQVV